MAISLQDMIAELRRELRHRQIIYPSLIKRGALTDASADRQTTRLQAALEVLVSLDEIDAAPEELERVTPEALAQCSAPWTRYAATSATRTCSASTRGTAFL